MYKTFSLVLLVAVVSAEWPSSSSSGSYPPSGWRPSGPEFRLPVPHDTYGPPAQEFVPPPPQEYLPIPSEEPTTTEVELTTTEQPTTTTELAPTETTTEAESSNSVEDQEQSQKLVQPSEEQGVYYIYHPSGLLQKVVYSTSDDKANMAYSASFKYEQVQPITGPVYTYDPSTFVFQRVN